MLPVTSSVGASIVSTFILFQFSRKCIFPPYFKSFFHEYLAAFVSNHLPATEKEAGCYLVDDKIYRLYSDFGKIACSFGFHQTETDSVSDKHLAMNESIKLSHKVS
jgi:hypothetical protein